MKKVVTEEEFKEAMKNLHQDYQAHNRLWLHDVVLYVQQLEKEIDNFREDRRCW
jgi:hypothetical protein